MFVPPLAPILVDFEQRKRTNPKHLTEEQQKQKVVDSSSSDSSDDEYEIKIADQQTILTL